MKLNIRAGILTLFTKAVLCEKSHEFSKDSKKVFKFSKLSGRIMQTNQK